MRNFILRRLMHDGSLPSRCACGHAGLNYRACALGCWDSGDHASLRRRTDCGDALPDDRLRRSICFACDETKPARVRNGNEPMRVSPLHSMLVRMPRGTSSIRETAAGSVFGMWRRMSKSHQTHTSDYEFAPPRSWPTSDVARAQLHTANYESWNSSTRLPVVLGIHGGPWEEVRGLAVGR